MCPFAFEVGLVAEMLFHDFTLYEAPLEKIKEEILEKALEPVWRSCYNQVACPLPV